MGEEEFGVSEPTPDDLSRSDLQAALSGLANVSAPDDLADAVMTRVGSERRWLGLVPQEWAFVGGSLGVFTVAVQAVISFSFRLMAG